MPVWLQRLIAPLSLSKLDGNHKARTLTNILLMALGVSVVISFVVLPISPFPTATLGIFIIFDAILIIAYILARKDMVRGATFLLFLLFWLNLTFLAGFVHSSLNSPAITTYILIIALVGLILGGYSGLYFAGLCLLSVIGIFLAGQIGIIPPPIFPLTPIHSLSFHIFNIVLAVVMFALATRRINASFAFARRKENDLIKTNQELQEMRATLENRVAKRTSEISKQKQYSEVLIQDSPMAIVSVDLNNKIVSINKAFEDLFGYTKDEVIDQNLDVLISTEHTLEEAEGYTNEVQCGETIRGIGKRRRKDGSLISVEIFGVPVIVDGKQAGALAQYLDLTERVEAEAALRSAKEQAEQLFRVVPSAIFTVDESCIVTSWNSKAAEVTGYSAEEVIGNSCKVFTGKPCTFGCSLFSDELKKPIIARECIVKTKSGRDLTVLKNSELLQNGNGKIVGGIESFEDITQRKETEEQLQHLATHDILTDLPNRALFQDRLLHAMTISKRQNQPLAVLFLDLDNFKNTNDTYGHEIGDLLLKAVAKRLLSCLRESDTICRLGGDEFAFVFAMMVENLNTIENASLIAKRILHNLSDPFLVNEYSIQVTASIGISLFPDDGDNLNNLLKKADKAMYIAKEQGKNKYQFSA